MIKKIEFLDYLVKNYLNAFVDFDLNTFLSNQSQPTIIDEYGRRKCFFLDSESQTSGLLIIDENIIWQKSLAFIIFEDRFEFGELALVDFDESMALNLEVSHLLIDEFNRLCSILSQSFGIPDFRGWSDKTIFTPYSSGISEGGDFPYFEGFGTFWKHKSGTLFLLVAEYEDSGVFSLNLVFSAYEGNTVLP